MLPMICTRKFVIAICIVGISVIAFVIVYVMEPNDSPTPDSIQSFIPATTVETYGVLEQHDTSRDVDREVFIEKVLEAYTYKNENTGEHDDALPPRLEESEVPIELIEVEATTSLSNQ